MNLGNVLNWANAILLEGFKDDVLSGYKKLGYDTEDKKLLSAIKTLNTENEIKELIKREIGKVPNVGLAVAKKYTPEEFIGVVTKSKRELNAKRKKLLYAKSRTTNAS